jgi:hypothetical protein
MHLLCVSHRRRRRRRITLGTSPREFRPVTPDRGTGWLWGVLLFAQATYFRRTPRHLCKEEPHRPRPTGFRGWAPTHPAGIRTHVRSNAASPRDAFFSPCLFGDVVTILTLPVGSSSLYGPNRGRNATKLHCLRLEPMTFRWVAIASPDV